MIQSAVRLPTPPPADAFSTNPTTKRKRSPPSRSPSPQRRRSPPRGEERNGYNGRDGGEGGIAPNRPFAERSRPQIKEKVPVKPPTEEEKQAAAKAEYDKLVNMRSGGTYIPPARLRALQAQIGTDKTSKEYQRMAWEALKKSINGLINKVKYRISSTLCPSYSERIWFGGVGYFVAVS